MTVDLFQLRRDQLCPAERLRALGMLGPYGEVESEEEPNESESDSPPTVARPASKARKRPAS